MTFGWTAGEAFPWIHNLKMYFCLMWEVTHGTAVYLMGKYYLIWALIYCDTDHLLHSIYKVKSELKNTSFLEYLIFVYNCLHMCFKDTCTELKLNMAHDVMVTIHFFIIIFDYLIDNDI